MAEVCLRTCLGCRQRRAKEQLWRFAADDRGDIVRDERRIMPGRGIYCCPAEECFNKMVRNTGNIARSLRLDKQDVALRLMKIKKEAENFWDRE